MTVVADTLSGTAASKLVSSGVTISALLESATAVFVLEIAAEAVKVAVNVLLSLEATLVSVPLVNARSAFVNDPEASVSLNAIVTFDEAPSARVLDAKVIVTSDESITLTNWLSLLRE